MARTNHRLSEAEREARRWQDRERLKAPAEQPFDIGRLAALGAGALAQRTGAVLAGYLGLSMSLSRDLLAPVVADMSAAAEGWRFGAA